MVEISEFVPVAVYKAGVDVVGPLHSSNRLQAHTCALVRHDVHQPVFKLVAGQVGAHKPGVVRPGVG